MQHITVRVSPDLPGSSCQLDLANTPYIQLFVTHPLVMYGISDV